MFRSIAPRRWWTLALFVLACTLPMGCNPTTLSILLMPFFPDDVPPLLCKISDPDKEVTVAVVCRFAEPQHHPALMTADQEIAEQVTAQLSRRLKENKEKVKFIPQSRVRSYLSKSASNTASLAEMGKQLKVDKVIGIDINSFSIYVPLSQNTLYQGRVNLDVKLVEVEPASEETQTRSRDYTVAYPREREEDAQGVPPHQFRGRFTAKIGKDLSHFFTSFPKDERVQFE